MRCRFLIGFKSLEMKCWIKISLFLLLGCWSCKEGTPDNPFDEQPSTVVETPTLEELNPTSFEGLHANIFKKTCANSGCHDGTFEPDFRTIESAYNTLVYHPIIKNDLQGTYEYRVIPGNADQSQLMARLTFDIDGNSGVMPLNVEPDSDWEAKSADYIKNVRDWIQEGAKDVFGNGPTLGSSLPQMQGVRARNTNWFPRADGGQGALRIPQIITSVDVYFAFSDEETEARDFGENKIRFSQNFDDFENATELSLEVLSSPLNEVGYYGDNVDYTHKISINPHDFTSLGEVAYFRVYVKDADNPITEIPSNGGAFYIKTYFSLTIIE